MYYFSESNIKSLVVCNPGGEQKLILNHNPERLRLYSTFNQPKFASPNRCSAYTICISLIFPCLRLIDILGCAVSNDIEFLARDFLRFAKTESESLIECNIFMFWLPYSKNSLFSIDVCLQYRCALMAEREKKNESRVYSNTSQMVVLHAVWQTQRKINIRITLSGPTRIDFVWFSEHVCAANPLLSYVVNCQHRQCLSSLIILSILIWFYFHGIMEYSCSVYQSWPPSSRAIEKGVRSRIDWMKRIIRIIPKILSYYWALFDWSNMDDSSYGDETDAQLRRFHSRRGHSKIWILEHGIGVLLIEQTDAAELDTQPISTRRFWLNRSTRICVREQIWIKSRSQTQENCLRGVRA